MKSRESSFKQSLALARWVKPLYPINEVDFILEKGDKVVGLEVKSGASADNVGMGVFNEKLHPNKMLLVGTGEIPYEDFLKINPKELF